MTKRGRRGYTRFELISVIIIVLIVIAIFIPVVLNFFETQRRSQDRQKAVRAEDLARQEYMLSHYDGEPVVYTFSGRSEVLMIVSHAALDPETKDFSEIELPKKDAFNDGGNKAFGELAKADSRAVGETELYVVVTGDGEVLYNSWLEILLNNG